MKKLFILLTILAIAIVSAQTPIFKNGDFSEKTTIGLPKFWRVVTKDVKNVKIYKIGNTNAVKMTALPKERMFLIQYPSKLVPGTRYKVSYDVKSSKKTLHRVYFDYRNEFGKLTCNDGSWNSTPNDWTNMSFTFLYPLKASSGYLVLNPDGDGEVEFKNVRFEVAPNDNVLKNPEFTLYNINGQLKNWNTIGKGFSLTAKDKVLRLTTKKNKASSLAVQWDIPIVPGQKYKVSANVKGKTPGNIRIYVEWRIMDPTNPKAKGRLTSYGGWWRKVTTTWQKDSFELNYPANSNGAYLILSAKDTDYVEFKDITVEAVNKNAAATLVATPPKKTIAPKKAEAKKVTKVAPKKAEATLETPSNGTNLIKNPTFTKNAKSKIDHWSTIRGKIDNVDGALRLTSVNKKSTIIAQWSILVKPGKSYKISSEVRASSPGSYRVYSEWRIPDPTKPKSKGRLSSYGGWWRKVDTKWVKDSFIVNIPSNSHSAYLVLSGSTADYVEFRNIKIEETVSSIPAQAVLSWGTWKIANTAKFSINKAGKAVLSITPQNGKNGVVTIENVKVKPNQRYALNYTIQGQGKAGSDTGFHPFRISVNIPGVKDDGGAWDDTQNGIRTKNIEFTVPSKIASNKAVIKIETTTRGTVNFWNLSLKELPPKAAELVKVNMTSPFFRDTLYSGSNEKTISGKIFAAVASAKVTLLDSNNKEIKSLTTSLKNNKGTFSFASDKLANGIYTLKISAKIKGQTVTLERKINKVKAVPNYTTFNGKYFTVNGKKFLPVTFWTIAGTSVDQSDEQISRGLYYAAKNGINSMIIRPDSCESALRYLNIAKNYNIKIFLATGNAPSGNPNTVALWEHKISGILTNEVITHPALLGYFLVDEPYWRGIPSSGLIASYNVLKIIDPYHPVWINAAPRGSIEVHAQYSKAADIYGVDVYPVGSPGHSGIEDKGLSSLGKYVIRMNKSCGDNKPIFMALQAFAWGDSTGKKVLYPTFHELRFMTYDCITSGGIGASYWGSQGIKNPAFYTNVLYPICRELMQISGILTADKVANVKASDKNIHLFAREIDGKNYVIAANTTNKTLKVTLSNMHNGKATVVNENRSVTVVNNKLVDSFGPYSVYIYAEGKLPAPTHTVPAVNQSFEGKENPVFSYMKEKLSRKPYAGKASWLWVKGLERTPFSKAYLGKEFTINKKIKLAELVISADDTYNLFINEKVADKNYPKSLLWNLADVIDVTKYLKVGKNSIAIMGEDGGVVPCGVIADLHITFADGTKTNIITDGSWKANGQQVNSWQKPSIFNKWSNASVVAPYGTGPWSNKMNMKKPVK